MAGSRGTSASANWDDQMNVFTPSFMLLLVRRGTAAANDTVMWNQFHTLNRRANTIITAGDDSRRHGRVRRNLTERSCYVFAARVRQGRVRRDGCGRRVSTTSVGRRRIDREGRQ